MCPYILFFLNTLGRKRQTCVALTSIHCQIFYKVSGNETSPIQHRNRQGCVWQGPVFGYFVIPSVFHAGYNFCAEKVKIWKENFKGLSQCTNTRLLCTHFNAFFMLNSNMTMKIWKKLGNFGLSSALDIRWTGLGSSLFFYTQVDEAPFNKCRDAIRIYYCTFT